MPSTTKPLWHSKTFWANVIAIVGLAIQHYTGLPLDAEAQVTTLAAGNIILRAFTHTGIK